jgi:GT2 family glycosyltransferase
MADAIDSILNQTFEEFELIISDNASTDRTSDIRQRYVACDDRVRYYRNERSLGASPILSGVVRVVDNHRWNSPLIAAPSWPILW